jgi:hypothetical protein
MKSFKKSVYDCWWNLVSRCTNINDDQYPEYGGRGIKVHPEWLSSFESFYKYVGDRPSGMSLDRIDNDGNYEPGNVRWATRSQQSVNTRKRKGTKSQFRGVSWDSSVGKWWVEISRNNKTYRLGRFDSELEASKAYEKKRAELDVSK